AARAGNCAEPAARVGSNRRHRRERAAASKCAALLRAETVEGHIGPERGGRGKSRRRSPAAVACMPFPVPARPLRAMLPSARVSRKSMGVNRRAACLHYDLGRAVTCYSIVMQQAQTQGPLDNLEQWDDFVKDRYDPNRKQEQFRQHTPEAPTVVQEFYRLN